MKSLDIGHADLNNCITAAQNEPVVLTQSGAPVVLILGVTGMDEEQLELGTSAEFWRIIESRRCQPTISRDELDKRLQP